MDPILSQHIHHHQHHQDHRRESDVPLNTPRSTASSRYSILGQTEIDGDTSILMQPDWGDSTLMAWSDTHKCAHTHHMHNGFFQVSQTFPTTVVEGFYEHLWEEERESRLELPVCLDPGALYLIIPILIPNKS